MYPVDGVLRDVPLMHFQAASLFTGPNTGDLTDPEIADVIPCGCISLIVFRAEIVICQMSNNVSVFA
jgi:hypothetical protein